MVMSINESNIVAALRSAETDSVVIVDLPGGASALALKAFHRSHSSFVLIPSQPIDAGREVAEKLHEQEAWSAYSF